MKCSKCGGLFLKETFYSTRDDSSLNKFEGLKCTSCGDIIDPVILQNRQPTQPTILSWTRGPDQMTVLVNSKKYTYDLPFYWIEKVERMWKHSAWKAFNILKKQGNLRRSLAAYHRSKGGAQECKKL